MLPSIIQIVIIVILIVLSAFFSSSETALTGVSSVRLRAMCDEGVKNALVLEKVLSQKDKMLSVILICNNIVNLSASALTTVVMQNLFGNAYVAIGTGVLTLLVLIFGEVAPKTMATYRAEKLALKFCGPIRILMIVFTPIAAVVNFLSSGVMRIFGVKKSDKAPITETELRTMVTVSQEEGVIESEEEELINNIIDFSDTIAREIMVPRINVTSIRIDSTYQEITEVFRVNHFTRLPVMDEANEKVVGIVNVKDLVFYDPEKIDDFRVEDVMREAEFTFENKHLWDLFMEMKKASAAMM
ncbi:MAG: DUF21 domain-containing protein, partial [Parasporobacterium sp.]|nr:DUF21 domain-containing protein [Parasporobacterium sp.]